MKLAAPEPLNAEHQLEAFDCRLDAPSAWPRKRALGNAQEGASRTYVVADGRRLVGYYALAAGGIGANSATGRFRRNMPDPIPVAILARLAVHQANHGQELGRAMFRDGAKRVLAAADILGIRGLIVHTITEEAKVFYLALGFEPSRLEPMTSLATLTDLRACL